MRLSRADRDTAVKLLLIGLVAVVLVPAALQALVDGMQQWEGMPYSATVTGYFSGSPNHVTFRVSSTGQNATVLSDLCYGVSQAVNVTYHPPVLWAPGYWEIRTPGNC